MKFKITIILAFIYISNITSQDLVIGIQTGMGSYHMGSLKELNSDLLNSLPVDAKIISDYPNHVYFKPSVKINYLNNNFGVAYSILSTGSRISYADYSGEYLFDTYVNGNSFGIFYDHSFTINKWLKLGVGIETGFSNTKLKLEEYIKVGEFTQSANYNFSSKCNYLQPNVNLIFPYKKFCFELNIGYYKEFNRSELDGENGEKIRTSETWGDSDMWDGIRLGFTVSYAINLVNEKEK